MVVGCLRLVIRLHGCSSLKEKRAPRRMLTDKIRSRFKVAVSEVDSHDLLDLLTLGVATVGADSGQVEGVLRKVADYVEEAGTGELLEDRLEIVRVG